MIGPIELRLAIYEDMPPGVIGQLVTYDIDACMETGVTDLTVESATALRDALTYLIEKDKK